MGGNVVKVKNQLNSFLFAGNMQLIIQLIILPKQEHYEKLQTN